MSVKIIISDTDGCIVREDKTKPPLLVDITPNLPYLKGIKDFLGLYPELKGSTCTTRSLAAGLSIVELAGMNAHCSFEGGNIIYSPRSGEAYLLIEREERLHEYRDALHQLQEWSQSLDEREVSSRFKITPENLRRLSDRKTVLTFEILPYEKPEKSGHELWGVIGEYFLPKEVEKLIEDEKLRVTPSKGAVDVTINITKADAVRHILGIYGFPKEQALGIGDRYHSDLPMLEETGYVAAPSNADDELKEYITRRGARGYISQFENGQGVLDILEHLSSNWVKKL